MTLYRELYVTAPFRSLIRKFWVLDNYTCSYSTTPKFALPNGCLTLAFISGGGINVHSPMSSVLVKEGIYLFGQISKRVGIDVNPFTKAIMAQLHPWAASVFTTFPLNEITNTFIAFQEVNKAAFSSLSGLDLYDENLVIEGIYKGLHPYLSHFEHVKMLEYICSCIMSNNRNEGFRISSFTSQTGYSSRFIEKKFKQQIGLTPKQFHLIVRIRNMLEDIHAKNNRLSFTQLAFNHGFYDQAHFNKTFSSILLVSPKNYHPQDHILPFELK